MGLLLISLRGRLLITGMSAEATLLRELCVDTLCTEALLVLLYSLKRQTYGRPGGLP